MLKQLHLENFRNHRDFTVDLGQTTVIFGPNGVGKSNILEALSVVSFCRSYRESDKQHLIHVDSEFARVLVDGLEVIIAKRPQLAMRAKRNGVGHKLTNFVGFLPSVILTPESLSIITGSPKERRKLLDMLISQVDPEYLRALVSYNKIRTQRNHLLGLIAEGRAGESELDYWDKELSTYGMVIVKRRREAIEFIGEHFAEWYRQISGRAESTVAVIYEPNSTDITNDMQGKRRVELIQKKTLVGPHRDELRFNLNGMDMAEYASRGEIKSAILALKVGELEYLKKFSRNADEVSPLLLLDDVFSEFDDDRRKHLCSLISQYQTVITTADRGSLTNELVRSAKVINLLAMSQTNSDVENSKVQ